MICFVVSLCFSRLWFLSRSISFDGLLSRLVTNVPGKENIVLDMAGRGLW